MDWTRRRTLASTVGVAVASLAGCLSDDPEDRPLPETPTGTWRQFAHDAGNTSATGVAVPGRGSLAWTAGEAETLAPVVDDGTVFSVGEDLTALDARTGDRLWRTDLEADAPATLAEPAATGSHVLVAGEGGIRAFAPGDGERQWTAPLDGAPLGPLAVATDERLAVVAYERRDPADGPPAELAAVDTESGETGWTAPVVFSPRTTPPAVAGARVYAAGYTIEDTPVLRALRTDTGELVWERELDSPETSPTVTEDHVLVGDGSRLVAYDRAGESRKSFELPGECRAVGVADGSAYVLSGEGVSALSLADGSTRWHFEASPRAAGICVGREAVVAPVSSDAFDLETAWPCIAAFDRNDGAVLWYYAVDAAFDPRIGAPPVLAGGAVFFLSNTETGVAALGDLPPREE